MSRPVKDGSGRPRQRRDGLVVQELPEETLIYDLERHQAHCLEAVAAAVWEACDGHRTVEQIAAQAAKRIGRWVPEEAVWLALRRLGRARLIEAPVAAPVGGRFTSRRDWLKKAALFGGLSVMSITAPTAAQAATCTTLTTCQGLQNRFCTGAPCCTTGPNPAPPGTSCKKVGNLNNCSCAP
jgi:hypothetical protein